MDVQPTALLNWAFLCQGKSMDELRQWLLMTTLELEKTRVKAQEELEMRENHILQLKDMLSRAIKEKNDAEEKCHRLLFERLLLQQPPPPPPAAAAAAPMSGVSCVEDEPRRGVVENHSNNGFSSSDSDESIVSSPAPAPQDLPIVIDKPLPEKGKFLQAVMKAGPLLQTLLLAGPLPQWRHPPPPMDTYQIPAPPVAIPSPPPPPTNSLPPQDSLLSISAYNSISNCGRINRKRGFFDDSDSSMEAKYQRVVL
ncbi:PREDICTED: WASH complex subunit CCDC53 homolog [Ipomoea nil]|uniref:WASH complex subunit CCDC53 homolog n=1 Tax=Ipomoea nil TaxID=35883 RepID=UPI000901689A|nr:PREDICTED: WASH complex subunit CCDC53 homolog [Ipomoea nil]